MSSIDEFAVLLSKYGHKLELAVVGAVEVRSIRLKSAAYIFEQRNKFDQLKMMCLTRDLWRWMVSILMNGTMGSYIHPFNSFLHLWVR